jgi:hypothetical protein
MIWVAEPKIERPGFRSGLATFTALTGMSLDVLASSFDM